MDHFPFNGKKTTPFSIRFQASLPLFQVLAHLRVEAWPYLIEFPQNTNPHWQQGFPGKFPTWVKSSWANLGLGAKMGRIGMLVVSNVNCPSTKTKKRIKWHNAHLVYDAFASDILFASKCLTPKKYDVFCWEDLGIPNIPKQKCPVSSPLGSPTSLSKAQLSSRHLFRNLWWGVSRCQGVFKIFSRCQGVMFPGAKGRCC